jgi:competence protein ComEA
MASNQQQKGAREEEQTEEQGKSGGGQRVDLNTATAEEIAQSVEGIGQKRAEKIVEYREQNGPFNSIEDVKKVEGISDELARLIESSASVGRQRKAA